MKLLKVFVLLLIGMNLQAYQKPEIFSIIPEEKGKLMKYKLDVSFDDTYDKLGLMVDKTTNQTITGNKTFTSATITNATISNNLYMPNGLMTVSNGNLYLRQNAPTNALAGQTTAIDTWTGSGYICALYLIKISRTGDGADVITYLVLFIGSYYASAATTIGSADGGGSLSATFNASGSGGGPYYLNIVPSHDCSISYAKIWQ